MQLRLYNIPRYGLCMILYLGTAMRFALGSHFINYISPINSRVLQVVHGTPIMNTITITRPSIRQVVMDRSIGAVQVTGKRAYDDINVISHGSVLIITYIDRANERRRLILSKSDQTTIPATTISRRGWSGGGRAWSDGP